MKLRRIGVLSAGKIAGIFYALIGLFAGFIFSMIAMIGMSVGSDLGIWELVMGVGAIIFMPIVYGLMGFVGGISSAAIYNLIAGLIGGLEIELE